MTVGFASLCLTGSDEEWLAAAKLNIDRRISDGRYLLCYWHVEDSLAQSQNWELNILRTFLLKASERSSETDWDFSANGAIRGLGGEALVSKTIFWVLLRKKGPKPYVRVKNTNVEIRRKSTIPVKDPAFTRDVANNVWHTTIDRVEDELLARFRALLSWSDEESLHGDVSGWSLVPYEPLSLAQAGIPKIVKRDSR